MLQMLWTYGILNTRKKKQTYINKKSSKNTTMHTLLIFVWIWAAMVATSFWEAYVEGKHPWAEGKLGWKIKSGKYIVLTAYHFFLFWITFPLLLTLNFVIYGFNLQLLGIIISAYSTGLILEDFFWFIVNPTFHVKNWNSEHVKWYPWLKIGKLEIPASYLFSVFIALVSWYFLWR
jgi:hypothetical protein